VSYRAIGFGEADLEIERELAAFKVDVAISDQLVPSGPPVAQAVYVCGSCFKIVDPCALNWANQTVYFCDTCAEKHFSRRP